jgi:hypothetical protein
MRGMLAGLSALALLCWCGTASAGPIADAGKRAEMLQAQGKSVEALDALDEAVEAIWKASPLAFRKVLLVDASDGYGLYSERTSRVFRPDEKMTIYVEPVGYGYRAPGSSNTIAFTADLTIENASGQVLGEAKNVFSLSSLSGQKKREFSMTLSFGVPYYRPGDYKAVFTVYDKNSGKNGKFEVPFSIALPTAQTSAPPAAENGTGASATP